MLLCKVALEDAVICMFVIFRGDWKGAQIAENVGGFMLNGGFREVISIDPEEFRSRACTDNDVYMKRKVWAVVNRWYEGTITSSGQNLSVTRCFCLH